MVKKLLIAALLGLLLGTSVAHADNHTGITERDRASIESARGILDAITPTNAPTSPLGFSSNEIKEQEDVVPLVQSIISTVTGLLAALAGIYALFMILKNAFQLITSDGDSKKIEGARKGILFSLLGLLGIMFSYLIIYTIVDTLFRLGNGGF